MSVIELNGITYENIPCSAAQPASRSWSSSATCLSPGRCSAQSQGSSRSPLIAETFRRPGSWQSMRIIYENAKPVDFMDRMALKNNPISVETRNRRRDWSSRN